MVTLTPNDLLRAQGDINLEGDVPVVRPLPPQVKLSDIFLRLCHLPHCLWLDSAKCMPRVGRYSFLTADPVDVYSGSDAIADPLAPLAKYDAFLQQESIDGLPPFQGGLAGVFGYDLCHWLEAVGRPQWDDLPTPPVCLGLYDWVIAYDHLTKQGWVICQGWPEHDPQRRRAAASRRLAEVMWWLERTPTSLPSRRAVPKGVSLAPQYATPLNDKLTSNYSPGAFRSAVGDVVDRIRRGDVFQVNLAQRLLFPDHHGAPCLYMRMRARNAAPQAGYFDGGDWQLVSASPERFLKVSHRNVETHPIKGTCRRTGDDAEDRRLGEALLGSLKDRAENVMIVDLMRNDLSRVCTDDSIDVTRLCALEQYECVQHLVSIVQGRLAQGRSVMDLIRASFPGGSITGAPKIESMNIISSLEPTARGAYCGSLGYLSTGGNTDLNILIRTVVVRDRWLQIPVGGGITSRSDPASEEKETWDKAEGMLRAVL